MKKIEKLPCEECKGMCCTYPVMTVREFKTIRKKYGVPKTAQVTKMTGLKKGMTYTITVTKKESKTGVCGFLQDGRCSVYDLRPDTCQKYGNIPQMPCMYLYPEEALQKVTEMMEAKGLR